MPLLFPAFAGLSYNVVRRPKAGSTYVQTHPSGREVRIGYWPVPLYEWDLTFNVLHDFQQWPTSLIVLELKRLQGFYLAMRASLIPFYFLDPDDSTVVGQQIGVGNGVATTFQIVRTFGDVSYGATVTEPIGAFDLTTVNIYLNGILQLGGYSLSLNTVVFSPPPAAGVVITVDLQSFYFLVRFKDDSLDFEKFSGAPGAGYWTVKKLTLESLRV